MRDQARHAARWDVSMSELPCHSMLRAYILLFQAAVRFARPDGALGSKKMLRAPGRDRSVVKEVAYGNALRDLRQAAGAG
jgi:hypothetical protein